MKKIVLLTLLLIIIPTSVKAQISQVSLEQASGLSLGIYPPITRIIIEPGRNSDLLFKTVNHGDPTVLYLSLVPFIPADETGGIKLIDCDKEKLILCDYRRWFSFKGTEEKEGKKIPVDQGSFFIDKNKTKNIKLQLFIPKDTDTGEYTFTLLLSSQPARDIRSTHHKLTVTLGSNILVAVTRDGMLHHQGKIVSFAPIGGINIKGLRIFDSFDNIGIILKVANSGKTAIAPSGEISLSSTVFPQVTFPIPSQYVLPNSTRILNGKSTLQLASPLYFGRYQAKATIRLAPNGSPITIGTTFWALPLKGLAALTVGLQTFWLLKLFRKNARKKQREK